MTASVHSILFECPGERSLSDGSPDFFRDLNLDQIIDAITVGRGEYDLQPYFYTPLHDVAAVSYRHEIMRDLDGSTLHEKLTSFAQRMQAAREHRALSEKLRHRYQKARWRLEAAADYGAAVEALTADLRAAQLQARGLCSFRNRLEEYASSERFRLLRAETVRVKAGLAAVHYILHIDGNGVTVCNAADEFDYGAAVEETFARFQQRSSKDHLIKLPTSVELNHVEETVLELVARRNPEPFRALNDFCAAHADYLEELVVVFDREIQFYLASLEFLQTFRNAGLPLCYPQVSISDKHVLSRESYDLALARKLIRGKAPVVCNDFELVGAERMFVVTGPNQGGKTTFARTFGQLHYLASLGLPVAGKEARLFLCDRLFTHFERAESVATLRGKLQDDLVRIHAILAAATSQSIVVMNEIFSSTSLGDATYLGRKIMERLARFDTLGVCVTFLDELTALDAQTVSLVALVAPDDPTRRTHRLARKPAEGIAHALALANQHRLTYDQLRPRLPS